MSLVGKIFYRKSFLVMHRLLFFIITIIKISVSFLLFYLHIYIYCVQKNRKAYRRHDFSISPNRSPNAMESFWGRSGVVLRSR
jgi:hypothetical protein